MDRAWFRRYRTLLIGVAVICAIGLFSASRMTDHVKGQVRADLMHSTLASAAAVDLDKIKALSGTAADNGSPDYAALRDQFMRLGSIFKVDNIYGIYAMRVSGGNAFFLLDSAPLNDSWHSEPGVSYEQPSEAIFQVAGDGIARFTGPYTDEYGSYYSVFAPIRDSDGAVFAVMGADVETSKFDELVRARAVTLFILLVLVLILFAIVFFGVLRRIESERKAQESVMQDRFRLLIENSYDALALGTADGKTIYVSPSVERVLGYLPEEFVALDLATTYHPDDFPQVRAAFQDLNKTPGKRIVLEFRFRHKDGSWAWLDVSAVNRLDMPGVNGIVTNFRNVTAHRNAEKRLADLAEQYRTVTEESLVGLYIIQNGAFTYVNPAFVAMFGYENSGDILGRPWREFTTEKGQEMVERSGIAARMQGRGGSMKYVFEAKRKNGTPFYPEVLSNPGTYEGKPAVIGTMVDVTERVLAEEKVKELDSLKNKFIQIVSHQFRTPLNAVRWNLESLMADEVGKLTKTQREFVRLTHDATILSIERLHDLLTALDIEEGRVRVEKERIDISGLAAGVVIALKKVCGTRELSCSYKDSAGGPVEVLADAEKLRVALEKIVSNAALYSEKSGQVSVIIEKKDGNAKVSIADSGIGIPKNEQKKMFTRFFRASNAATMLPDASGLGLYIAKYFIEAQGGKIGFKSEEGKGSTFWVEMPL